MLRNEPNKRREKEWKFQEKGKQSVETLSNGDWTCLLCYEESVRTVT